MDVLHTLSQELATLVDAAGRSVVRVDARRRRPASGTVWSADGILVTTAHAVERDDDLTVGLPDGGEAEASLVGRDPLTNVAVLRVKRTDLIPATWAEPDDLRVGHLVVALGRPGRTVRARFGIAGAIGGEWRTPHGGRFDRYIEAAIGGASGFSGGPLLDARGRAVGLTARGLLPRTVLAIPATTLRRVADTLLTHGRMQRGYLGLGGHPVTLPAALRPRPDQETGLLVVAVEPGAPADRAGVLLGDTLVALNDQPIHNAHELSAWLSEAQIGTPVALALVRAGQPHRLDVVVGERP